MDTEQSFNQQGRDREDSISAFKKFDKSITLPELHHNALGGLPNFHPTQRNSASPLLSPSRLSTPQ